MHADSFSQLRVYRDGELVGLLTAETVARWLASRLVHGLEILEEAVEAILQHGEEVHGYLQPGRDATVFDAPAAFEDRIHAGKVLDAIILTRCSMPSSSRMAGSRRRRPSGS